MQRRNQTILVRLSVIIDMLLIVLSYIAASRLWLVALSRDMRNIAMLNGTTMLTAAIYACALVLALALTGFYSPTLRHRLRWRVKVILLTTTLTLLAASFLLYIFKLGEFSRGVLLLFYLLTLLLLTGKYTLLRLLNAYRLKNGYGARRQLVIGTGELARQYAADAETEPELAIKVYGYIGNDKAGDGDAALPCLGGFDQLDAVLANKEIEEVVIALEPDEYRHITELIAVCEKNGVKYSVIPFYNDLIPAHPVIENVGSSKLINMRANRLENIGCAALKRGFDIITSAVGLIVLSPLLLAVAIGVKLSSPGPVLFRQKRIGYMRREFNMLKFRSMKVNDKQDTAWSSSVDDRRTPFGSLIRKTSIDELPQLINVLRGDMSLVGPRPELPHFVEQFRETIPLYMVKHQVKPGITGWAQINGYRGDTSIEKRIELDLWYIDNWSFGLDLKILLRTLFSGMVNDEQLNVGKAK